MPGMVLLFRSLQTARLVRSGVRALLSRGERGSGGGDLAPVTADGADCATELLTPNPLRLLPTPGASQQSSALEVQD